MKSLAITLLLLEVTLSAQDVLQDQHVDLSVNFSGSLVGTGTNPWLLTVRDEDMRNEYAGVRALFPDPLRVILEVPDVAQVEVPDDSRYTSFLGPAGSVLWILPQTQDPNLLYAGASTENKTSQSGWTGYGVGAPFLTRGVASGVFKNNQVTLSLASFSGPGDFFLYSTNAFGDPLISYNTSDGLSASDARVFSPGSHVHFNWAFTEPGDYTIGLRASGTLNSGNVFTESDVTEFHFHVVPEPSALLMVWGGAMAAIGFARVRRGGAAGARNIPEEVPFRTTGPGRSLP